MGGGICGLETCGVQAGAVLSADVVHSMDIAAAVGAERLREIMAELAVRCATVV